jgi:hypothetical protein
MRAAVIRRLSEEVMIVLVCCDQLMEGPYSLSLREAGEAGLGATILGYECTKCRRQVSVWDCWYPPDSEAHARMLEEMDATP